LLHHSIAPPPALRTAGEQTGRLSTAATRR